MAFIDAMTQAAKAALAELNKANAAEGFAETTELTGMVYMDIQSEAVWFQVEDSETRDTNWVSRDFPEYAAIGETAVVAVDEDDMRNFEANHKPEVTYRVIASDVDGLTPDEDLYTGLTRDEALATADSCRDMAEQGKSNFLVKPDPRP